MEMHQEIETVNIQSIVVTSKIEPRTPRKKERKAEHDESQGRIPRITKLMALAIHLQGLVDQGVVKDYADIARLTGLTRARITQIMNMNLLAPQIQEAILFLPRNFKGSDPISERNIRHISLEQTWDYQKNHWININANKEFCLNVTC